MTRRTIDAGDPKNVHDDPGREHCTNQDLTRRLGLDEDASTARAYPLALSVRRAVG